MRPTEAVHVEEHLGSSEFTTDIVIGMSDGLTVPFALAVGILFYEHSLSGTNCLSNTNCNMSVHLRLF